MSNYKTTFKCPKCGWERTYFWNDQNQKKPSAPTCVKCQINTVESEETEYDGG